MRTTQLTLNDRVVLPSGAVGIVVAVHPTLDDVFLVQPLPEDMAWYAADDLTVGDEA